MNFIALTLSCLIMMERATQGEEYINILCLETKEIITRQKYGFRFKQNSMRIQG